MVNEKHMLRKREFLRKIDYEHLDIYFYAIMMMIG